MLNDEPPQDRDHGPHASTVGAAERQRVPAAIVIAWPDYSAGNPYQGLLYARNDFCIQVRYGPLDVAIELIAGGRTELPVIFHLHWLNWLFRGVASPREARRRAIVFISDLNRFRALGGIVVWTIHNELSHDSPQPDAERLLSDQIVRIADQLLIHDLGSLDEISEFEVPRDKVVELPHGHYIGTYPNTISREEARSQLGLAPEDDVCLFFGQLRPYKGVEELIEAFRRLLAGRPRLKLLIVGRHIYDPFRALAAPLTDAEDAAIQIHDEFVADDELQKYFRAADIAVFPYRKVLTSGSVMLALSFRLPVAVADCAMIRTVLADRRLGAVIPAAGAAGDIQTTLENLLARKVAGTLAISNQAWADFVRRHEWRDYSLEVVRKLVEHAAPYDPEGIRARLRLPMVAGDGHSDT
ncbi:glycosyltransferase [Tropicimonas sp. IMCC6043]|uniref:glycosyltransferase n=1 Tax=Tropicimonas sp. IMCC6043 TaxID=2510645 RepID=UPI00101D0401|nr:glycosyltransferase [Tropicimonas sp. IMCC6043]RYH06688.1 glycosyltransferase [Tropicimonas sp. IMCC6043]